ncbi:MAG: tetratricopeptide repeat protein [Deltaproteobacteria bacterium]|nr:tetratricopeptide repeat protein [Deltaproteobacteria bacterium]
MGCPSTNSALDLVDGELTDEEAGRLRAHLAECGICRQLVAELSRTSLDARAPRVSQNHKVPLVEGATIGRYVIESRLAAGGFGVVYRARDPELDRTIALKLWRVRNPADDGDAAADMLREAQALARLSHPNVMAVHDVGTEGDQVFIAGEFIDGNTLGEWAEKHSRWQDIVPVMARAGQGLVAAHDADLVHGDFKPDNVVVDVEGRPRVVDFGLARPAGETRATDLAGASAQSLTTTTVGYLVGTPAYMAPELLYGEPASDKSDQYAFCVSLFELLAGDHPFEGSDLESLITAVAAGQRSNAQLPSNLPRWLAEAIERGLATDPDQRHPDMRALLSILSTDPRARRKRLLVGAAIVAPLVALAAVIAWPAGDPVVAGPCRDSAAEAEGVWTDEQRARISARFTELGGDHGRETFARIDERIQSYKTRWQAEYAAACKAHTGGGESELSLELRLACLDDRRIEIATFASLLGNADGALVERAPRAITQLAPVSDCASAASRDRLELLPEDPTARRKALELEGAIAQVRATRWAGKFAQALAMAIEVKERADQLGHEPTRAKAWFHVGFLHSYMEDGARARDELEGAYHAAVASRHQEIAARAAIELVMVNSMMLKQHSDALSWARHADSALKGLGNDDNLRSNYWNNLAETHRLQGKLGLALEEHDKALALREKLFGKDDPSVAQSLNNLGLVHNARADHAAAAKAFERAHRIFRQAYGPNHPYVGLTAGNLGELYRRVDPDKAGPYLEEAERIKGAPTP